jgi:membrane-associated phospholipid phosphatase
MKASTSAADAKLHAPRPNSSTIPREVPHCRRPANGEGFVLELVNQASRKWQDAVDLSRPEKSLLLFVLATGLVAAGLALALHRDVDWPPFLGGFAAAFGMAGIGAYIRRNKAKPRLALGLIGFSIFAGFTAASSVLIYSLLPLPFPMVDDVLTKAGHWLGYDWQAFVAWMTGYPWASRALAYVYQSALPQILLIICLLAAYGRSLQLYRFLLVGMLTLLVAVAIWWRWPSVGYVGVLPQPSEVLAANGFVFGRDYGGYLTRLLQEGPGRITPDVITGVVGFPSYHTVMACMVVWYSRRTFLFFPILLLNLAMIPATLLHGGHHLIDVIGGLMVFAAGVWITNRLIRPETPA